MYVWQRRGKGGKIFFVWECVRRGLGVRRGGGGEFLAGWKCGMHGH